MDSIDFVILWVDGNDPKWLSEKNRYYEVETNTKGNQENRFRDWGLLKYWFRGVEKNVPWVNKIFFVTYGHIPSWLNTENPKLKIVKHEDFIPKEYLPTFNSNVIQYYLNRIEGLSERFVMFDDDIFVLKSVKENDFFEADCICDMYREDTIYTSTMGDTYPHCLLNNVQCINTYYSKRKVYRKNIGKYFNVKYGLENTIRTLLLLPWSHFVNIYNPHICHAYTKYGYDLFWKYCGTQLKILSSNRFRKITDYSTHLVRCILLLEGKFVPRSYKFGKRVEIREDTSKICDIIKKQKCHVLCINDTDSKIDFEKTKNEIICAFEVILPDKCSFEV